MGLRVLVVDDDASMRVFLKKAMVTFGYDARLASNGFEALDIIAFRASS